MTMNARIVRRRWLPITFGQRAVASGVADQASLSKERRSIRRLDRSVRIVTRGAAQCAAAPDETGARPHLFDLTDGLKRSSLIRRDGPDQHAQHFFEPLAWPKILEALAMPQNPYFTVQVALIADAFAAVRVEPGGIDDRRRLRVGPLSGALLFDVTSPWTVAAFAADCRLAKRRIGIP